MSLRRVGYRDGRPIVIDEGPARGHTHVEDGFAARGYSLLGGEVVAGASDHRKTSSAAAAQRYREKKG